MTVGFALMVLGGIFTLGSSVSSFNSRIDESSRQIIELQEKSKQYEEDSLDAKVRMSEIQTQLKSIDATLVEIKQKL